LLCMLRKQTIIFSGKLGKWEIKQTCVQLI
jgi:hypothetical protein